MKLLPRGTYLVPKELAKIRCPICRSTDNMFMLDTAHASVPICFCPTCMYQRTWERSQRMCKPVEVKKVVA